MLPQHHPYLFASAAPYPAPYQGGGARKALRFIMSDWHITFIFKAEQFAATRTYPPPLSAPLLLAAIAEQQAILENTCNFALKSFLRTDPPPPKPSRYLSTSKPLPLIEVYLQDNRPRFTVEFLHQRKDE